MGLRGLLTAFLKRGPECRDIRMAASDYIDGDPGETQVERVRAHLGGCRACRAFVDTLVSETVRLLGTMKRDEPAPDAPAGLKAGIRARIAEEGPSTRLKAVLSGGDVLRRALDNDALAVEHPIVAV